MAEQTIETPEGVDELGPIEAAEATREISETEKRLRRDLARYREQAKLAQTERDAALSTAARERDEAIAAARDDARNRVLQAELKTKAMQAGILDLDALKLADIASVTFDEHGDAQGIEEVVTALRERKPYLFAADARHGAGATTAQTQRAPQPMQPAVVDARGLSHEAWQAERNRLLAMRR